MVFIPKLGMRIPYFMPPYGLFRTTGRVGHLEMLTADRSAARFFPGGSKN